MPIVNTLIRNDGAPSGKYNDVIQNFVLESHCTLDNHWLFSLFCKFFFGYFKKGVGEIWVKG